MQQPMTEFNLVRVIYGKKDTPASLREYRIKEFNDTTAVGTLSEIKEFLRNNGYPKTTLILHDNISPPTKSVMSKKKGWKGESVRHGMSARGLPSGRKKTMPAIKIPKSAILTKKPKAGTYYEIEQDETEKERTSYYLQTYDKKTGNLLDELPLGRSIPKAFDGVKLGF